MPEEKKELAEVERALSVLAGRNPEANFFSRIAMSASAWS